MDASSIAKHACASRVSLCLSGDMNGILPSIQDDGVGYDAAQVTSKPGLGFSSIRERIRLIQGVSSTKSGAGHPRTRRGLSDPRADFSLPTSAEHNVARLLKKRQPEIKLLILSVHNFTSSLERKIMTALGTEPDCRATEEHIGRVASEE